MSPKEMIKTPTARKRFLIGMSPGPFSCIAGNIIASYYLGAELDTAGITSTDQQLKAVSSSLGDILVVSDKTECGLERVVPALRLGGNPPPGQVGSKTYCYPV